MDADKWDKILHHAAAAFGRFGFRKTSMEEVAQDAGVAKGTLYLGCKSKRDLFYQAVLRQLRQWNAELSHKIDPRIPADQLLILVCREALRTKDHYPLARDLILGVYDQHLPDWPERIDELRGVFQNTLLEILRVGARQGRFRTDLDREQVAVVILDMITTSIMYHSRDPDSDAHLLRHMAAVFDLALHGLLADQA